MVDTSEGLATKGDRAPLLVGRTPERLLLRERFDAILVGRGSLVLIGGEAGIGKTALAEVLAREVAEQGALVLIGRCYDFTETVPYGLWIDLFSHYPEGSDCPSLPEMVARCGTTGGATSQADLFAQVYHFLSVVALKQPLVLFLDDLHCTDPASLDLFHYLTRQLATIPLLLVATYRTNELTRNHPLYALLPSLVSETHTLRLDLRPLCDDDVRALVT